LAELKVGAQLIIWGRRAITDLPSVLDDVASLGYAGIEINAWMAGWMSDFKSLLDSRGLSLAGLHLGMFDMKIVNTAMDFLGKMDGRYLIFSGACGKENTDEDYRRGSRFLDEVGRRAEEKGVKVCYHNHWQEIVNNARGIKIIYSETSPKHVSLCVDTYWVKYGGLSPIDFIKENLDRIAYLHLKDGTEEGIKRREFLELGKGTIDFSAIMETIESSKIEWIVVEQDVTNRTPKESMAISRRYLKEAFGL